MEAIPIGAAVVTVGALLAVAPRRRPRWLANVSWVVGNFANELPAVFAVVVVAPTAAGLVGGDWTTRDTVTAVLVGIMVAALGVVVARSRRARPVVRRALEQGLGTGWRGDLARSHPAPLAIERRRRWLRILFVPWPLRPRSVERVADVGYGDRGDEQLVDVYRHRSRPDRAPTLIHLHGGRFRWGRKSRESRALLFRLAGQGWTCLSANYHLSPTPAEGFPTHLVDVKRLLAWARGDGRDHGIDPDHIVVSGSSAGAHLTAMAAFTAGEPAFQPGFEDADTSFAAGIGLGGYYGGLDGDDRSPTSPLAHHGRVPPFLVVHGDRDTSTPVESARRLVDHLRRQPGAVVAYVELPGGQHAFDLFASLRFEAVVDGVDAFTAWLLAARGHFSARG